MMEQEKNSSYSSVGIDFFTQAGLNCVIVLNNDSYFTERVFLEDTAAKKCILLIKSFLPDFVYLILQCLTTDHRLVDIILSSFQGTTVQAYHY